MSPGGPTGGGGDALAALAGAALALALVLGPVALASGEPGAVLRPFFLGPFGSPRHVGNVLEAATPMLFTGLAVCLMFRAGFFNVGAEGAFFLGGTAAAAAVLLGPPLPGPLAVALAVATGAAAGSLVCFAPGLLRARTGSSELVASLLLNYVALAVGLYVLNHLLRDPQAGAMVSHRFPPEVRPTPLVAGTRIHLGTVAAPLAALAGGVWLFSTRHGFEARLVGANPGFARHLGLPAGRIGAGVQLLAGAIAAAGGAIEVLAMYGRLSWQRLPGAGWDGLVVAILAGLNPWLLPFAALFVAYTRVGGDILSRATAVPNETVGLIHAVVLVLVTARLWGGPGGLHARLLRRSPERTAPASATAVAPAPAP